MRFAWQFLLPMSLINLLVARLWQYSASWPYLLRWIPALALFGVPASSTSRRFAPSPPAPIAMPPGPVMSLAFAVVAGLVLGSSIAAVSCRNRVHAGLFLAVALVDLAFVFLPDGCGFLRFIQILVYVGAVAVPSHLRDPTHPRFRSPRDRLSNSRRRDQSRNTPVRVLSWGSSIPKPGRHRRSHTGFNARTRSRGDCFAASPQTVGLLLTAALIGHGPDRASRTRSFLPTGPSPAGCETRSASHPRPNPSLTMSAASLHLLLAAAMFCIGLAGALCPPQCHSRVDRHRVVLNAANLNFLTFLSTDPHPQSLDGPIVCPCFRSPSRPQASGGPRSSSPSTAGTGRRTWMRSPGSRAETSMSPSPQFRWRAWPNTRG